jgi:hypothetical protein
MRSVFSQRAKCVRDAQDGGQACCSTSPRWIQMAKVYCTHLRRSDGAKMWHTVRRLSCAAMTTARLKSTPLGPVSQKAVVWWCMWPARVTNVFLATLQILQFTPYRWHGNSWKSGAAAGKLQRSPPECSEKLTNYTEVLVLQWTTPNYVKSASILSSLAEPKVKPSYRKTFADLAVFWVTNPWRPDCLNPLILYEYNKYKYFPLNLKLQGVSHKAGQRVDKTFFAVHISSKNWTALSHRFFMDLPKRPTVGLISFLNITKTNTP